MMRRVWPTEDEERVRSGWLLLPKTMRNRQLGKTEMRWLERATWAETFMIFTGKSGWYQTHWIDEERP